MRENQIKFQHASAQSEKRMIIRHVSEPHIALKVTKMERVPENVKRTIYSFLATDEEVVQPAGLSVSAPEANASKIYFLHSSFCRFRLPLNEIKEKKHDLSNGKPRRFTELGAEV